MDRQVIQEIKKICGDVQLIEHIGCLFNLYGTHCMYMDNKDPCLLKIAIPSLTTVTEEKMMYVTNIINQVNREIKYVKSFLLDNGCVSVVYERKIIDGEKPEHVVEHVIKTLRFASEYVKQRITTKKPKQMVTSCLSES